LAAEAGRFPSPIFLVKAGQGGSQISDWQTGATCGYWEKLVIRYNAAVALIHAMGYTNINTVVMYSQGINDAGGGDTNPTCHPSPTVTPTPTWVTRTQDYFATRLRPLVGATTPIIMSKFGGSLVSPSTTIDSGIDAITAADPLTTSFQGDPGLWLPDWVHRDYPGYKNWAGLSIDNWLAPNGQAAAPTITPAPGDFNPSVTITITPPVGGSAYYSTDGSDPLTTAQKYTGPFTVATPVVVQAAE
jgi:hypothetical protein